MERKDAIKRVNEMYEKNTHLLNRIKDDADASHLKDIAVSCICTKYDIDYPGGGFVQAVVNNDLYGAISRGDTICAHNLLFIVTCLNNFYN